MPIRVSGAPPHSPGGWCPLCYSNVRGRSNFAGHRGYRAPRVPGRWEVVMALRRAVAEAGDGILEVTSSPGGVLVSYPLLWEHLSVPAYEDGGRRELSTLAVFVHDGRLTASLNDRDQGRVCFRAGATLEDALCAIEGGLSEGTLDWRRSAGPGKPKRK